MTSNIGRVDRALRVVVGIVVLGAGLYFRTWWGLIGLIPLATAVIQWCPLYAALKIDTRRRKPE